MPEARRCFTADGDRIVAHPRSLGDKRDREDTDDHPGRRPQADGASMSATAAQPSAFRRFLDRIAPDFVGGPLLHIASDVGQGPAVILLHGIASTADTFAEVAPRLEGYRRITIELLGFGGSPAGTTYTIEEHVAAIHRTVRSLRLRAPFILVGHSLGSLLSARYAARHPRLVERLVLISPPVYLTPEEIGDPIARLRVKTFLRSYEFLRTNKDFTVAAAASIGRLLQLGTTLQITEDNWDAFTQSLKNCIESQTTIADISSVAAPVDVVYGGLDQFLAGGTLRIIERMRHVTMHRVELHDHVVRGRLAAAAVAAIRGEPDS